MTLPVKVSLGLNATRSELFSKSVSGLVSVNIGPVIIRGWTVPAGAYLQCFNDAVANITLGTTVPDLVIKGSDLILKTPLLWDKNLTIASTTLRGNAITSAADINIFYNVA